ncbi:Thioredoxin-like superfamily [Sesbania bispinosa]|nr:Thioredoxin-like superfamily [Sesbania bispinosa]
MRIFIVLSLTTLLLFSSFSHVLCEEEEDLSFLEEPDENDSYHHHHHGGFDDDAATDFDDFSGFEDAEAEAYKEPEVDDKDVVVLKDKNFTDVVKNNQFVMVEFYAPWCGHCQALAPEYAAAATELKGDNVILAKVDATEENELAQQYDIQGFPTIYFFVDGIHKPYNGHRTKEAIVTWIKKKTGPGIHNITTVDDAQRILTSESKVVLGFLDSLVGPESEELASASRLEDDVNFYQTVNPDVAKLFHIDPTVKRPALILVKKEAEKLNHFGLFDFSLLTLLPRRGSPPPYFLVNLMYFHPVSADGQFVKSEIADFVSSNKLPLVTIFTRESAPAVFENPIKKQLLLFATSNDSEKFIPVFQEAAKLFKGKLIFVYVEMDNEDVGKPVSDYFGVSGSAPKVLAYTGNDDGKKFVLDGEVTVDKIKSFGEDFLEDKLKPFFKSDPVPESNDGDVKIVVGNNFDEIVLDESKDVLLEIYAPWCGHCQALEPIYNKLAKHLHEIESLVIAKMDGTTNEHPRAKADGYPTILFFPAGNKSFDPITVDTDRTVVAFYKFLKKHASIPFKLQKPTSTSKPESSDVKGSSDAKESSDGKESQRSNSDVKDEL